MKRIILLYISLLAVFSVLAEENNKDTLQHSNDHSELVATIVDHAMEKAPFYGNIVRDYRSELYVKGRMYVRKKNVLFRFVPSTFKLKKGVKEYLVESVSDLHFTAPNIYDQKVKAVYGTVDKYSGVGREVLDYFHVNVYTPFLLRSKLLSPLSPTGKKYYTYKMDSILMEDQNVSYRITFTPKNRSYQLVEGYVVISDGVWSVREMQFSGRSEYLFFDNLIKMGDVGTDSEYLPECYELNTTFQFMGNKIDGSYTAMLDYHAIELQEEDGDDEGFFTWKKAKNYDLTESYNLQCDTTRHYTDSLIFNKIRPLPLSTNESHIYENYYLHNGYIHNDSIPVMSKNAQSGQFWGQMGDMLISNYTVNLSTIGSVKCSPLINPFLVSYSGRDGFSYRQDFKYSRLFSHDRLLRLSPKLGYNFKHREFYWRMVGDYDYWPRKRASWHLRMGNGNRIYTSEVLEEIKEMPDTIFDFDKIHLDYFKDFYVDFRHRVEITNGLILDLGISTHKRTAGKKSDFTPIEPLPDDEMDEEITDKFRNRYVSFAPRVVLSWTPGQYYYMNGERKINLHSKYPTFSVDWERGVKGILGSTGVYERIELDMQHRVSLGLMKTLYYRAGMGAFTDQDQIFFVDFVNFSRNNLPIGWNDEIGGVFQLLDRRWYNASRKYMRANVTYEAPFLVLPRLLRRTRNILNERLYLGVLTMPHLNPYVELGYGIGTHIFDFGLFVGNTNGKFDEFGFKLTFELFNR